MKSFTFRFFICFLVFILVYSSAVCKNYDNSKPVLNKEYTVHYNTNNKIFNNPKNLTLIYTFDLWDAPFSRDMSDSILIAKCANSVHKKSVQMIKNGDTWEIGINIPQSAKILSYIITDGVKYDLNNQKTYSQYIYNDKDKPARESCVFMMQLLEFTKQSYDDMLKEIKKEFELYPANFSAYYFYWKIILYKEEYKKETVDRILDEIKDLYKKYPNNPEVCEALIKVYRSGVLSNEKLFKIISSISANLLNDESKNYLMEKQEWAETETKHLTMFDITAPDFNVNDLEKNNINLSGLKGKVVLLYFFYPTPKKKDWIDELDSLQKVYIQFGSDNFKVFCFYSTQVMQQAGIIKNNGRTSADSIIQDGEVSAFIKKKNYSYSFIKHVGKIADDYKTHFLSYFLIDKKGVIRNLGGNGFLHFVKEIKHNIGKLLLK
jgi:peroxiredoxin